MKHNWMRSKATALTVVAILSVGSALPAAAEDIIPPVSAERPLILGLGVMYQDKTYKGYSDSDKVSAVPLVMWENDTFFVRGTSAGWKAWRNDSWEFDILAEVTNEGYDSSDADILTGMDDRDRSAAGGVSLAWHSGPWGLRGVWVHDLLSKSDGYEARAELSYTEVSDNQHWIIKPSAALVYQSDDMVDYYYGVPTDEAVPGARPAYDADSDFIYRIQTVASWNPGGSRWQLFLGGRFDIQGDEFDDSPITSDDKYWMAFFGTGYRF